ncbi:MAG TPA: carboxypeptidase-like regulatory domain-containing protein, partial [Longimicrobium sp.]|nr:carboxypeptidase-like regulatory domain-containing protein [Longimicrobium sp.]
MRRLLVCPLLALLLLSGAAAHSRAQEGGGTDIVRGRVTDATGSPVSGARVVARDLGSGVSRAAVTGRDGRYAVVFAEGGGRYEVLVSRLGFGSVRLTVAREADEDVLVADARLAAASVGIDTLNVRASRQGTPGRAQAGSSERTVSGELAERLPLRDNDPATLATLSPGVVATAGADSASGGFSVAGQRSSQNNVTLDGAGFAALLSGAQLGADGPGVPPDGVRGTRVITSTYDVARGQFSGGQVETTTRAGTGTVRGSGSYQLRDDRLNGSAGHTPWAAGFTQHRATGGIGGPLLRDRLFYFASFTVQRRVERLSTLEPRSPAGFAGVGVSADSVARFLAVMQDRYGVPAAPQAGAFGRTGSGFSVLGRVDYVAGAHAAALRGFASGSRQNGALVRPLDARQHGGESRGDAATGVATLTSRLGAAWINELRAAASSGSQSLASPTLLPEARVRVSTLFDDGA